MKSRSLRTKEIQPFLSPYAFSLHKKDTVELVNNTLLLINKKPSFFYYEKKLVPTLQLLQEKKLLKEVVVDMGAVPFLIGGADVMRPGITELDARIQKGAFVVVVDSLHKKALAVGITLFAAEGIQGMTTGKVITNIHHIGDAIWRFQV